jgi:hypothetical protein
MKRVFGLLSVAAIWVTATAGAALAQDYPTQPTGGAAPSGDTAFTGGDVSGAVIALVILATVGLVALFAARRRSVDTTG